MGRNPGTRIFIGTQNKDCSVLGYDTMYSKRYVLMFQRNILASHSGSAALKEEAAGSSETLVPLYQTTRHQIPGAWCHGNLKYQSVYGFEVACIIYKSVDKLHCVTADEPYNHVLARIRMSDY
jgi:hypothetical protein